MVFHCYYIFVTTRIYLMSGYYRYCFAGKLTPNHSTTTEFKADEHGSLIFPDLISKENI